MAITRSGNGGGDLCGMKVVRQVDVKLYEGGPVTGNPCSVKNV